MSGRGTAVRNGEELRRRVVDLGNCFGLGVETEVRVGYRLWGATRKIDVVFTHMRTTKQLGIVCKYQQSKGSVEEKIIATVKDMEGWPMPGMIVIDGQGFSKHIQGFLLATGKVIRLPDLEDWLRLFFAC
jgi:hypothetical protein